jgi:CubicO group peptidase (beta-lactamase class C family)
MKIYYLLIAIFCISSFLSLGQDGKTIAKLDKELASLLNDTKTAGYAVAIVKRDKVIYSKGFGYRDLEGKKKVDENTLFAIGSSTKAFTTALLGLMEEEKGLSFDDSPKKYLPELEFFNDELNSKLTITDLVSHRTGLPRHDFSWYLFPTKSKDSLLMRVKYHEPFAGIREHWYYNNFMYLTQGLITEKLTGKTWEENVKERFFTPLNMSRSNVSLKEWLAEENSSFGYKLVDNKDIVKTDYYDIAGMSPAGSINSSVKEMSNWLITWINNGKYKGKQVIPEKYIQQAIQPQMIMDGLSNPEMPSQHLTSYGYAWMISSYKGHYRVEHGGNIDGFSANVCFFPTDSIGIVVLTNQDGSSLPSLARNTISDYLLNVDKTDWGAYYAKKMESMKSSEEVEKTDSNKVVTTSRSLIEYEGTYSHKGYGTFTVELKNDSLFAQFPIMRMYLKPFNHDVFEPFVYKNEKVDVKGDISIKINFASDDLGEIASANMKIEPTLEESIKFKRTPKITNINKDLLKEYTGKYELSGMKLAIRSDESSNLFLTVPGQPEYTLLPTSDTVFVLKDLNGYKVEFIKGDDGKIKMNLIQPNGTFTAVKE